MGKRIAWETTLKRLIGYLRKKHAPDSATVFIVTFLSYTVLCLVAWVFDIGFFDDYPKKSAANGSTETIVKQVGYLTAPNWGILSLTVLPLLYVFLKEGIISIENISRRITENNLVLDKNYEPVSQKKLENISSPVLITYSWISFFVLSAAIVFALYDFFSVAGNHLLSAGDYSGPTHCDAPDRNQERDWSVAGALRPDDVSPTINFIFGLVVYLLIPGISFGLAFSYFVIFASLQPLITRLKRHNWRLFPNFSSADRSNRMGFEAFEPLFTNTLFVTLFAFVGLNLMSIQNVYLRTCDANFFDFMFGEGFQRGLTVFTEANFSEIGNLLGFVFGKVAKVNLQVFMAVTCSFFIFCIFIILVYLALRKEAERARKNILRYEDAEPDSWPDWLRKVHVDGIFDKARVMQIWPMAWPRINMLLVALLAGVLATFFYRLSFLFAAAVVVWVGIRFLRYTYRTVRPAKPVG